MLVNTIDPYEGVRPINFVADEHTSRFEIAAAGACSIELVPLRRPYLAPYVMDLPGAFAGIGDMLVFAKGDPDLARATAILAEATSRAWDTLKAGSFSSKRTIRTKAQ